MPEPIPVPIEVKPGVSKKDSALKSAGRWVDMDKVRFVDELPEKIGGWTRRTVSAVDGPIRNARGWVDSRLQQFTGLGTARKLYVNDASDAPVDITPIESTGTLTDPFTTTVGSALVNVEHTTHGRAVGDEVRFDNATVVAGITIDGAYNITAIVDEDNYVIEHSAPANDDLTGGGTVDYEYELPVGYNDPFFGDGYGAGGYGLGDYGEPSEESAVLIEPRVWALAEYGRLLLANPIGYGIYVFDPEAVPAYQRATALANAPTSVRALFVTPERFIMALGCDNDPMLVKWPDQDDPENWTPGFNSTANQRRLNEGTRLIDGLGIGSGLSAIWSDKALYIFQYTGSSFVYDSQLVASNAGLIAPDAGLQVLGTLYWMSPDDFLMYSGGVQRIPNSEEVRDHVFETLRREGFEYKNFAYYNRKFNEVWWYYVPNDGTAPGLYVAVSLVDFSWIVGTMERTAAAGFSSSDNRPVLGAADGFLYLHEDGKDANGAILPAHITLAPMQLLKGARLGEVQGFIADFKRQIGELSVKLEAYDRIDEGVMDSEEAAFDPKENVIDMRVAGRHVGLTIRSAALGGDFRLGEPVLEVKAGGKRR